MYRKYFKAYLDILVAVVILVITLPVFMLIAFILLICNQGSIFYYQIRPGQNEVPFKIIKFKTMTDKKDSTGTLLPDDERITKLGKVIRKLSLDELPQLFSVLKGDMSLIGPRPLLLEYLDYYNEEEKIRHTVKPGITGWAQVNGRNTLTWKEKLDHDIWYVGNLNFKLDIKIFLMTILRILKRDGINTAGYTTAPKYNGNN